MALITSAVRRLAPLPGSVHDLLLLDLKDPNLPESLQAVVEKDPVLAAHVLRIANSAAYRGLARVEALPTAILRVGAPMIIGTFLQTTISQILDPYHGMGRRLGNEATLEANLMAALATTLETRLRIRSDVAYVHGLLHDIGHLLMAMMFGKAFEEFRHREVPADDLGRRETHTFGFDHQVAGRILSNYWKLPEDITVVIASHHYPAELRIGHLPTSNAIIDLLALTDRLGRIVEMHPDRRTQAEAEISAWLITPEADRRMRSIGASPDEVIPAVQAALGGLEREQRVAIDPSTEPQ